jgi:[protein-PII] uridylyltransferase
VISDEHDLPLTEPARQQLHDAMLACLDPDRNAGDPA